MDLLRYLTFGLLQTQETDGIKSVENGSHRLYALIASAPVFALGLSIAFELELTPQPTPKPVFGFDLTVLVLGLMLMGGAFILVDLLFICTHWIQTYGTLPVFGHPLTPTQTLWDGTGLSYVFVAVMYAFIGYYVTTGLFLGAAALLFLTIREYDRLCEWSNNRVTTRGE